MKPVNHWPQGGGKASYPPTFSERIRIESFGETVDSRGLRDKSWSTFKDDVPAAYMPVNGVEFIAAEGEKRTLKVRFPIPYLPGTDATMRVIHRGNIYSIISVTPDPTQALWMTLLCETGATSG